MKTLKKIYYDEIEKINWIVKLEKIYRLPVFQEWFSEKQIEQIDMKNFIFAWKRNWDWYFLEKVENKFIEKVENIYFSKNELNSNEFVFFDFIYEIWVYLFLKK